LAYRLLVEPVRGDTGEGTVTYNRAVGACQYLEVLMYALAGADVPLLDSQQGLLSLPGLDPAAKYCVAVAQFALRIEPLLQSGAVGGTGLGRRSFLLIAGGDNFRGGSLHSATECPETRRDLTQVSICSSGPLRGTDRGRTDRRGYLPTHTFSSPWCNGRTPYEAPEGTHCQAISPSA
jgi:hypothetical protein